MLCFMQVREHHRNLDFSGVQKTHQILSCAKNKNIKYTRHSNEEIHFSVSFFPELGKSYFTLAQKKPILNLTNDEMVQLCWHATEDTRKQK